MLAEGRGNEEWVGADIDVKACVSCRSNAASKYDMIH